MVDYMRTDRIEGAWPASERVLVVVDSAQGANTIVRHAKRMADRLRAQWTTIHVETPADARASEVDRDKIAQTLRLAQRLGAPAISIPGEDATLTVAEYAKANHFAHIIAAKSTRPRWRDLFGESFTQKLIRAVGDTSVHIVARVKDPPAKSSPDLESKTAKPRRTELKAYVASLAYVAVATSIAALLHQALGVSKVALVFLIAVLASAVTHGL
jgi:two-component system, OmpR family, sensor histidine kinase KdpD